jgi:hypothetical protein
VTISALLGAQKKGKRMTDYSTMTPAELVAAANDLATHSQHMSARAQALRQLANLRQQEQQLLTSLPGPQAPPAAAPGPVAAASAPHEMTDAQTIAAYVNGHMPELS